METSIGIGTKLALVVSAMGLSSCEEARRFVDPAESCKERVVSALLRVDTSYTAASERMTNQMDDATTEIDTYRQLDQTLKYTLDGLDTAGCRESTLRGVQRLRAANDLLRENVEHWGTFGDAMSRISGVGTNSNEGVQAALREIESAFMAVATS